MARSKLSDFDVAATLHPTIPNIFPFPRQSPHSTTQRRQATSILQRTIIFAILTLKFIKIANTGMYILKNMV